jgi:hypothetical protein
MQVTPPPPASPPPPKAVPEPSVVPPKMPLGVYRLPRSSGGVAAVKRSRHGLWMLILVILAVLVGFGFVRFVLTPTIQHSTVEAPDSVGRHAAHPGIAKVLPWTG